MHPRCPQCGKDFVRRSHRQGAFEHLLSAVYVYPFRCQLCTYRFRAFEWGAQYKRHLIDQREYERIPVRLTVNVSGDRGKGQGTLTDLSMGGCTLQTEVTFVPGELLQLSFQPTEKDPAISVEAAVVRSARSTNLGVEFLRLQAAQKDALRQFVFRHLSHQRD